MSNKIFLVLSIITFSGAVSADLDQADDCYVTVKELAAGIANSSKQYQEQPAKVINLNLTSATEVRNYSLDVEESVSGCINSYDIQLSNDSAFKCVIEEIKSTQICG